MGNSHSGQAELGRISFYIYATLSTSVIVVYEHVYNNT